jgi:lipase maturation factor 1
MFLHFTLLLFPVFLSSPSAGFNVRTTLQRYRFPILKKVATSLDRRESAVYHFYDDNNKKISSTELRWGRAILEHVLEGSVAVPLGPNSYILSRSIFLRAMAFVHFVAFTIAYLQNKALIGDQGITPCRDVLNEAQLRGVTKRKKQLKRHNEKRVRSNSFIGFYRNLVGNFDASNSIILRLREIWWDRSDSLDRPTTALLWLAKDRNNLNPWLDGIALAGVIMSATILFIGCANLPMVATLWICQRSLMSVGGIWYGYGWESQLNELSFHALFMVPIFNPILCWSTFVPPLVLYMLRWHLFRVMFGSGLIKFRSGDTKWFKEYNVMNYFYETQPIPNPLSKYMHRMPNWWHKVEVMTNHAVECLAPWILITPNLSANWRRFGGLIQIVFQTVLISSGNLNFVNWLTIVPAILSLDDQLLYNYLPRFLFPNDIGTNKIHPVSIGRQIVSALFFLSMLVLSIPVVRNLASRDQVMHSSFDKLGLVNSYGAFGTVNENRDELIISATTQSETDSKDDPNWKEYEFKAKPGNINKSPVWLSPYHYRLDWQMWVASTSNCVDHSPWIKSFLLKLLEQDPGVLNLLENDPWKNSTKKPVYIRIDKYRYKFQQHKTPESQNQPYWDRSFISQFYPKQGIASIDTLKEDKTL